MEGICKPATEPLNPVREEDVCVLLPAVFN